jgi:hypothetical protein
MLEHLSRVARVVKTPGGNALLVGVGGSGRQSCSRLACFLADFDVFQVEIARGYDQVAFREDLKKLLRAAGGKGEKTVFLFTDSQIKSEGFVEDLNNLLNSGEVPNLFPPDEKVQVAKWCGRLRDRQARLPKAHHTNCIASSWSNAARTFPSCCVFRRLATLGAREFASSLRS